MHLTEVHSGLWSASYPVRLLGLRFSARTTICDLGNRQLWVCSPGRLTREALVQLHHLGEVRWVVAPNSFHHLHLGAWRQAFPTAHFSGVPMLGSKRGDFHFDSLLHPATPTPWPSNIKYELLQGSRRYQEAVFLLEPQKTLVVTDLVFHVPPTKSWWQNLLWRTYGVMGKPASSPVCKWLVRDRRAARLFFETITAWPAGTLLTGHGPPLKTQVKEYVHEALSWMRE